MTEDSILWTTSGTGDGASTGYTQTELIRWLRQSFISDNTDEGVAKNYLNELEVTGVATPVSVDTGAAYVYGFPYWNTASVDVAIPTPTVATRIDRIVLRASWSAQTVRITRIAGTEGGGAPALTQTDGDTWDVPLAQASVTTGGVITVTDERIFVHPNIEVEAGMLNADVAGDGLQISSGALAVDVSDFAGDALADDGSENLDVQVDDTTIEVSGDALQVKASGISNSHIANRTRNLFVPAVECYNGTATSYVNGTLKGWPMPDAAQSYCYASFRMPADFASGATLQAIFEPAATGNVRVLVMAYYGNEGEACDTHTDSTGRVTEAVVQNINDDLTTALSLASIDGNDYVICYFDRDGADALDTINDILYFVGFLVSYTADM